MYRLGGRRETHILRGRAESRRDTVLSTASSVPRVRDAATSTAAAHGNAFAEVGVPGRARGRSRFHGAPLRKVPGRERAVVWKHDGCSMTSHSIARQAAPDIRKA